MPRCPWILALVAACAPPPPAEPEAPPAVAIPAPVEGSPEPVADGPPGMGPTVIGETPQSLRAERAHGGLPFSSHPAMMDPGLATKTAPPSFRVELDTTQGRMVLDCERDWAPHGVDRFYNLVDIGYFDGVAFFRVVKGFAAQFGIHGDPAVSKAWKGNNAKPDKVKETNLLGYLTFAQAGMPAAIGMTAKSRSTQLFFNLMDNMRLDRMGFAPLCRTAEGLDVLKRLHSGYGDEAGRDQAKIAAGGDAYLRATYPDLDYIKTARLVP